ncbi:hypothetical protein HDU92_003335 [Lobulomyces angularis]|nr:hypothetical protein HDU92_003335 [Lobulomyces angularis]
MTSKVGLSPLPPILDRILSPENAQNEHSHSHEESQVFVSLRVCKHCQDSLLQTFHHCLSKQTSPESESSFAINSLTQIDEVEDAKRLKEPPYFNLIKDPTKFKNNIFVNSLHAIERDRTVLKEMKALPFSGNLYRQTLQQHKKEIMKLKKNLYDKTKEEEFQLDNVERLRLALQKAVKYYAFAEEWQSEESSRLQYDVKCLKGEMSSLMAFLINSEEEKRMLVSKVNSINEIVEKKEQNIKELSGSYQELKQKLHTSYKEYLEITETVKRLEVEAESGSDVVRNKNEILQRNLDKLSKDFEICSKDLTAYQLKIKELEFELEEISIQFTQCGDAKKILEVEKSKLLAELNSTIQSLKTLNENHDIAMSKISMLELKIIDITVEAETTNNELQTTISTLSKDLSTIEVEKKDVELKLKVSKSECEKLTNILRSTTKVKDQQEAAFRVERVKLDREILIRDDRINEFISLKDADAKHIKKLQEAKEQLLFQVNDLQNSLDREASTVNSLNFELIQLRKTSEEQITTLEDSLEKLNVTRVNLTNDKRQLMDKVKSVRSDLAKKEEQFNSLSENYDKNKVESGEKELKLKQMLIKSQTEHKKLQGEFKTLEDKAQMLLEQNVKFKFQSENLQKRLKIIEDESILVNQKLELVTKESDEYKINLQLTISERDDFKQHLDSVLTKISEVNETMNRNEMENQAIIKQKDSTLKSLNSELQLAREQAKRFGGTKDKLAAIIQMLTDELDITKQTLKQESACREKLEVSLDDLRKEFSNEKKNRFDLERVQIKIARRDMEREAEMARAIIERDRLLRIVEVGLKDEHTRLFEISSILPPKCELESKPGPNPNLFPKVSSKKLPAGTETPKTRHSRSEMGTSTTNLLQGRPPRMSIYNIIHAAQRLKEDDENAT